MPRFSLSVVLIVTLLAAACGGGDSPTEPPPPTSVTEAFSGTLTLNGARVHSFTVTSPGGITALLSLLEPDSMNPVGLLLGTWNGSICQHVPGLSNDATRQGEVVVGQTTATGDFCVRIFDAAGTVTRPQNYTILVTYPGAR